jgi:hypothetical protein
MPSLNVPLDTIVASSILKKVSNIDVNSIGISITFDTLNVMHVILTCRFIV